MLRKVVLCVSLAVLVLGVMLCVGEVGNIVTASEGGLVGGIEWVAKELRGDNYRSSFGGGSFVSRADGKMLITYEIGNTIMLSVVDSEKKLFSIDNICAENEWPFYERYSSYRRFVYTNSMLQKLMNGHILLYIFEHGVRGDAEKPCKLMVFRSKNGLGTDFEHEATIYEFDMTPYTSGAFGDREISVGQPIQLESGRILVPFTARRHYSGSYCSYGLYCGYSDDNGKSWNVSVISNTSNYYESLKGLGRAGDQLIALVRTYYSGGTARFYYTNDNGENWLRHNEGYELKAIGDMVRSDVFWGSDGYTYLLYSGPDDTLHFNLYRHDSSVPIDFTGQKPYEVGEIGSGATWEGPLLPFHIGDDGCERLWITDEGRIAVCGTSHCEGGSIAGLYGDKQPELQEPVPEEPEESEEPEGPEEPEEPGEPEEPAPQEPAPEEPKPEEPAPQEPGPEEPEPDKPAFEEPETEKAEPEKPEKPKGKLVQTSGGDYRYILIPAIVLVAAGALVLIFKDRLIRHKKV